MDCLQWLLGADRLGAERPGAVEARRLEALAFCGCAELALSRREGREVEVALARALAAGDGGVASELAGRLLAGGCYEEALVAYARVAEADVDERALCLSQIGAALLCLDRCGEALASFVAARDEGADEQLMDDAIWEACEAWAAQVPDPVARRRLLARYRRLCPNGRHRGDLAAAERRLLAAAERRLVTAAERRLEGTAERLHD